MGEAAGVGGSEAFAVDDVGGECDEVAAAGRDPGRVRVVLGADRVGRSVRGAGDTHAPAVGLGFVEGADLECDDLTVEPSDMVESGQMWMITRSSCTR
jgi:hypothetical protein